MKVQYYYDDESLKPSEPKSNESLGFVSMNRITPMISTLDAEYYFVGPKEFMRKINLELKDLEVDPININYEFFGPAAELE